TALEQISLPTATLDPEPSPPSPRCAEQHPEPTVDREPELVATDEPLPHGATEQQIATEPELQVTSVQVRVLATTPATRENAMDSEIAKWNSAHCNMAE
ncbi:hypothetical protein M9458_035071, partial [Cirrhinus mrigala]